MVVILLESLPTSCKYFIFALEMMSTKELMMKYVTPRLMYEM